MKMLAAMLLIIPSVSFASPHTHRFQNPGPTLAYTHVRTEWGTFPAPCAPGATCSVVVDIPFGQRVISMVGINGSLVSPPSNSITILVRPTPVECMAIPACRYDSDQDGHITPTDFGSFLSVLGRSWIP